MFVRPLAWEDEHHTVFLGVFLVGEPGTLDLNILPGTAAFQRTFSDSLHLTGGFAPGATPFCCGPRHCCQSAAEAGRAEDWNNTAPVSATTGRQKAAFMSARTIAQTAPQASGFALQNTPIGGPAPK